MNDLVKGCNKTGVRFSPAPQDMKKLIKILKMVIDNSITEKKKIVNAKGQAKSISTATLVIDEGGKFSQANVSTAMKKLCDQLVSKLKI